MSGFFFQTGIRIDDNSRGGALIGALLLVAISAIMGATILFATSTDLQISGNYRRALQSFYIAEAGIAESQTRLGGLSLSNPMYVGDTSLTFQPNWSAYVLAKQDWKSQDDPDYSTFFTNYIPKSGNPTNTAILLNSIQTALPYWTKIHHKTEFDAELAGHSSLTPHYQDTDGNTTSHSKNNMGNIIFHGFASKNELRPIAFTSVNPTPYSPIEIIISQSEVEGAISRIRVEAARPPGPPLLAPLYAQSEFIFAGGSAAIQGFDSCGLLAEGRPPVSLGPAGSLGGNPTLTGNPPTAQRSPEALDLLKALADFSRGAQIISGDLLSVNLGAPENPVLLYGEPHSGGISTGITVQNVKGFGILLIKGNINISAPFHWEGFIIVSGQVIFDGGFGTSAIYGALFADQVRILSGDVTVTFNTCPIAASLRELPVFILNWQQML